MNAWFIIGQCHANDGAEGGMAEDATFGVVQINVACPTMGDVAEIKSIVTQFTKMAVPIGLREIES